MEPHDPRDGGNVLSHRRRVVEKLQSTADEALHGEIHDVQPPTHSMAIMEDDRASCTVSKGPGRVGEYEWVVVGCRMGGMADQAAV